MHRMGSYWNSTKTPSHPQVLIGRRKFGQLLLCCRMILLVPSLLLAFAVLAWIAWVAFGPRSSAVPQPQNFVSTPCASSEAGPRYEQETRAAMRAAWVAPRYDRDRFDDFPLPSTMVAGGMLQNPVRWYQRLARVPSIESERMRGGATDAIPLRTDEVLQLPSNFSR